MATFTINKKGGYEISEVDSYIKNLEQQLAEYKNKSAAINKAIISAQVASDNMIKASQDEATNLIKRAKEEANTIKKQAEMEKAKILEEANDRVQKLKQDTKSHVTEIKANISNQKELVAKVSNDYTALINKLFNSALVDELLELKNKYTNSSVNDAVKTVQNKLDEIDAMADELTFNDNKSAKSEPQKAFTATTKPAEPKIELSKPAEPKIELSKPVDPKPVTASFSSKPASAPVKESEKSFVKTDANTGSAMNSNPVHKSYDTADTGIKILGTGIAPTKPGIYRVPVEKK